MESGEVPPPRKANARSLVSSQHQQVNIPARGNHAGHRISSAPDKTRIGMSGYYPPGNKTQPPGFSEQRARRQTVTSMNISAQEPRSSPMLFKPTRHSDLEHIKMLLKEEIAKNQTAARQYSICEEELAAEKAKTSSLTMELQSLKLKKQSLDNELAQSTVDYVNSQSKLMEQMDTLNTEVQELKKQLANIKDQNEKIQKENSDLTQKAKDAEEARQKEYDKRMRPDNVQTNSIELERRQNQVLIEGLKECYHRFKAEIEDLKKMNERLVEENENFQVLLVEKTVAGELPDVNSDHENFGTSLADEELLEDTNSDYERKNEDEQSEIIELKRTINSQRFDIRSLQNHNKALTTSLERLIDRMLNNSVFAESVEEAVSESKVRTFRSRVSSYNESVHGISDLRIAKANISPSSSKDSKTSKSKGYNIPKPYQGNSVNAKMMSPFAWGKMIVNKEYTGNPNRRAISLGIDDSVNKSVKSTDPALSDAASVETSSEKSFSDRSFRRRDNSIISIEKKR